MEPGKYGSTPVLAQSQSWLQQMHPGMADPSLSSREQPMLLHDVAGTAMPPQSHFGTEVLQLFIHQADPNADIPAGKFAIT